MGRSIILPFVLLAVFSSANAWWNCHECMTSVTINLAVDDSRYSGTDNENKEPHKMLLKFECNPQDLIRDAETLKAHPEALLPIEPYLIDNSSLQTFKSPHPKVILVDTAEMEVELRGIILKGQGRTYETNITDEVVRICGDCVTPRMFRQAFLKASHPDGIRLRSVSVYSNFQDGCSGFLSLNRGFARRRSTLDTNRWPDEFARSIIPLEKTGC